MQTPNVGSTGHVAHDILESASEITRCAWPNRFCTPAEALEVPNRQILFGELGNASESELIVSMPHGRTRASQVTFYRLESPMSNEEAEWFLQTKHKVAADPFSTASIFRSDPRLMLLVGVQWRDYLGRWCDMAYDRWSVRGQIVTVMRRNHTWPAGWRIPGMDPESVHFRF